MPTPKRDDQVALMRSAKCHLGSKCRIKAHKKTYIGWITEVTRHAKGLRKDQKEEAIYWFVDDEDQMLKAVKIRDAHVEPVDPTRRKISRTERSAMNKASKWYGGDSNGAKLLSRSCIIQSIETWRVVEQEWWTGTVTRFQRKGQTEHTWFFTATIKYPNGVVHENFNFSDEVWRIPGDDFPSSSEESESDEDQVADKVRAHKRLRKKVDVKQSYGSFEVSVLSKEVAIKRIRQGRAKATDPKPTAVPAQRRKSMPAVAQSEHQVSERIDSKQRRKSVEARVGRKGTGTPDKSTNANKRGSNGKASKAHRGRPSKLRKKPSDSDFVQSFEEGSEDESAGAVTDADSEHEAMEAEREGTHGGGKVSDAEDAHDNAEGSGAAASDRIEDSVEEPPREGTASEWKAAPPASTNRPTPKKGLKRSHSSARAAKAAALGKVQKGGVKKHVRSVAARASQKAKRAEADKAEEGPSKQRKPRTGKRQRVSEPPAVAEAELEEPAEEEEAAEVEARQDTVPSQVLGKSVQGAPKKRMKRGESFDAEREAEGAVAEDAAEPLQVGERHAGEGAAVAGVDNSSLSVGARAPGARRGRVIRGETDKSMAESESGAGGDAEPKAADVIEGSKSSGTKRGNKRSKVMRMQQVVESGSRAGQGEVDRTESNRDAPGADRHDEPAQTASVTAGVASVRSVKMPAAAKEKHVVHESDADARVDAAAVVGGGGGGELEEEVHGSEGTVPHSTARVGRNRAQLGGVETGKKGDAAADEEGAVDGEAAADAEVQGLEVDGEREEGVVLSDGSKAREGGRGRGRGRGRSKSTGKVRGSESTGGRRMATRASDAAMRGSEEAGSLVEGGRKRKVGNAADAELRLTRQQSAAPPEEEKTEGTGGQQDARQTEGGEAAGEEGQEVEDEGHGVRAEEREQQEGHVAEGQEGEQEVEGADEGTDVGETQEAEAGPAATATVGEAEVQEKGAGEDGAKELEGGTDVVVHSHGDKAGEKRRGRQPGPSKKPHAKGAKGAQQARRGRPGRPVALEAAKTSGGAAADIAMQSPQAGAGQGSMQLDAAACQAMEESDVGAGAADGKDVGTVDQLRDGDDEARDEEAAASLAAEEGVADGGPGDASAAVEGQAQACAMKEDSVVQETGQDTAAAQHAAPAALDTGNVQVGGEAEPGAAVAADNGGAQAEAAGEAADVAAEERARQDSTEVPDELPSSMPVVEDTSSEGGGRKRKARRVSAAVDQPPLGRAAPTAAPIRKRQRGAAQVEAAQRLANEAPAPTAAPTKELPAAEVAPPPADTSQPPSRIGPAMLVPAVLVKAAGKAANPFVRKRLTGKDATDHDPRAQGSGLDDAAMPPPAARIRPPVSPVHKTLSPRSIPEPSRRHPSTLVELASPRSMPPPSSAALSAIPLAQVAAPPRSPTPPAALAATGNGAEPPTPVAPQAAEVTQSVPERNAPAGDRTDRDASVAAMEEAPVEHDRQADAMQLPDELEPERAAEAEENVAAEGAHRGQSSSSGQMDEDREPAMQHHEGSRDVLHGQEADTEAVAHAEVAGVPAAVLRGSAAASANVCGAGITGAAALEHAAIPSLQPLLPETLAQDLNTADVDMADVSERGAAACGSAELATGSLDVVEPVERPGVPESALRQPPQEVDEGATTPRATAEQGQHEAGPLQQGEGTTRAGAADDSRPNLGRGIEISENPPGSPGAATMLRLGAGSVLHSSAAPPRAACEAASSLEGLRLNRGAGGEGEVAGEGGAGGSGSGGSGADAVTAVDIRGKRSVQLPAPTAPAASDEAVAAGQGAAGPADARAAADRRAGPARKQKIKIKHGKTKRGGESATPTAAEATLAAQQEAADEPVCAAEELIPFSPAPACDEFGTHSEQFLPLSNYRKILQPNQIAGQGAGFATAPVGEVIVWELQIKNLRNKSAMEVMSCWNGLQLRYRRPQGGIDAPLGCADNESLVWHQEPFNGDNGEKVATGAAPSAVELGHAEWVNHTLIPPAGVKLDTAFPGGARAGSGVLALTAISGDSTKVQIIARLRSNDQ